MTIPEDHMQERQVERDMAIAAIGAALNAIGEERRQPDEWERVQLFDAVMAVFSGCYSLAEVRAHLALTPLAERSLTVPLPKDAVYGRCELPLLNQLWEAARHEQIKAFPSFGPIEILLPPAQGKAWLK